MPLAETAVPLARILAGVLNADLELVRVVPTEVDPAQDADSRAQTYLARFASGMGGSGLEVGTCVLHGDTGKCVVQEATAERVASVVMSTHARSGMRRAVLGSVAEYVVAHCPVPTVLTRGGIAVRSRLHTLLVAIDATCAAPLPTVMELAQHHDVRVVLLGVVAPQDLSIWQWQSGPTMDEPQAVYMARQPLDDVATWLRTGGIHTEVRVGIGAPAAIIDEFAERVDADLIVMASHGRTGAQRAIRGSVADAVVRTAGRPVMVCRLVPPPPRMPDALDIARATQHVPPPLVPQTIPDPPDGVWHRQPSAGWRHLSGALPR
jgi:nucleotide-binding universal stress UspA family protein